MNAADVMTANPQTLPPSAPLSEAIRLMRDQRVRHLPITTQHHVVGVLSDRDLRELALAAVLTDDPVASRERLAQPISALAHTEVVTVNPETELRLVVDLLIDRRIGAVPVIEADGGRLVGLVSTIDVLRAVRGLI